jgi:hypothetical protein
MVAVVASSNPPRTRRVAASQTAALNLLQYEIVRNKVQLDFGPIAPLVTPLGHFFRWLPDLRQSPLKSNFTTNAHID